jgi:hypothetical protein
MSLLGQTVGIISATLSGETDIVCDNLTANTITLPSGDLQTTLDNIVAGSGTVGPTGPAGADGQDVSFYAPFITTLSAGSSATVSDVITTAANTQNHQLTFNIPRGDKGEQGNQGSQGPKGDKGNNGENGTNGDATAATASAAVAAAAAVTAAGSAYTSSVSSTASAVSAASAATDAASANATASEISARTTHIDTLGLTYYTIFNRNGGGGVDFLLSTETLPRLTIGNNGSIIQYVGTTTLNNVVVNGSLTGNLTGTAVNATNVGITTANTNATFYPTFSSGTDDYRPLSVDTGLTYNPFTNILSCDLSGTATKVLATVNFDNKDFNVPFLNDGIGNTSILSDLFEYLMYNPYTTTLSTKNIKIENILPTTATLNIGDASTTSTINIEGQSGCEINIGVAAFLNTINIGNQYSSVNIKSISNTSVMLFNPLDQMNGIF